MHLSFFEDLFSPRRNEEHEEGEEKNSCYFLLFFALFVSSWFEPAFVGLIWGYEERKVSTERAESSKSIRIRRTSLLFRLLSRTRFRLADARGPFRPLRIVGTMPAARSATLLPIEMVFFGEDHQWAFIVKVFAFDQFCHNGFVQVLSICCKLDALFLQQL